MVAVICSLCGSGGSQGAGTLREFVCACVPAEGSLIALDLWDTPSDRNKIVRAAAKAEHASIHSCSSLAL